MKLVTFKDAGGTRIGVVDGDRVLDLARADPRLPMSMRTLLEAGAPAMQAVADALAHGPADLLLADLELMAPVPDPHKFFAIALNYHLFGALDGMDEAAATLIREQQASTKRDNRQMWYNKQVTCIAGPFDDIAPPAEAQELYFEAELAFVVGRTCRNVAVEEAPSCIAGYTICNDVTEGLWCRGSATLTFGKSFDTFGPQGPWLVTADEVGDPHALAIEGAVNGIVQQSGNTRDMIFNCFELVSFASRRCTLQAGDIVTTGMPYARLKRLENKDVVRCTIEKLGSIENTIDYDNAAGVSPAASP